MYNYKIFPLEWDENKNKANIEKHGLTFDDAELVFSGITKTVVDDRYNYGEIRHITFGMLASRAVVIAHTQREERIRIISMRKANEREKNIIKSNLKKLDALRDHDIDYSDIPEMDDVFLQRAITVELPRKKESVTLRIDHEVLAWFKEKGRGYQTRMNAVLKTYVRAQQEHQRA